MPALVYLITLTVLLEVSWGHVRLTYPPARKYSLDYLDNYRTTGDCGMEPGEERTEVLEGARLNISWHLGYVHSGGYKIELVNDTVRQVLVPTSDSGKEWMDAYMFSQNHLVDIPNSACSSCYILLTQKAGEYGDPQYVIRSCADISILPSAQYTEKCSGNGQLAANGNCSCNERFSGAQCQYESECESDLDCGGGEGQGQCAVLDNTIFPYRVCLCSPGWFGPNCGKLSSLNSTQFNPSLYALIDFNIESAQSSGDITAPLVYWRLLNHGQEGGQELKEVVGGAKGETQGQGEEEDQVAESVQVLEMVVVAPTLSWVGIGWRSADANLTCQEFPTDIPPPRPNRFGSFLHPMDCTDMVVGLAREGRGRLADFYSRDISTPNQDQFWGGEDDLVAGVVTEVDGHTTMMFRKRLNNSPDDKAFTGDVQMIWALGQDQDFYGRDQFKYHGHTNRGGNIFRISDSKIPIKSRLTRSESHLSSGTSPRKSQSLPFPIVTILALYALY